MRSLNFFISTDPTLLQLDRVHAFLSQHAYWCKGIPYETVAKAAANSLCFGAYRELSHEAASTDGVKPALPNEQIGYARVVTDYATFAWICDVYVEESARGHGVSKALVKAILDDSRLQGLRRICLGTHDAHDLYKQFGFTITKTPQNWMEIKDDQIYLRK